MPKNTNGMQPMQMQTSASSSAAGGISSKPIIIILSAVILGLLSLVVGGGVAVYKVIQTHHMNSDTLQQLKSVESMVQQLKLEQKTLMSALIDKEKELEDADFVGDSAEAEKKEAEMEKILDEVIEVEDEIEEEEEVEDEIEDELHSKDKNKGDSAKSSSKKPEPKSTSSSSKKKKPSQKEVQAALSKKINAKQEAIKKKEAERKKAFPILNVVKDEDKSKGSGKAARSLRGQR
eukprot:INCI9274.1.p1 GENE.INCI9274.1~~INCI9274.1.p1  ORF type:complete len:234 (-),score=84.01 INCI9274.1:252-953(-)